MAVINITITNSTTQIISGIPQTVSISTNISATIFFTLDGSTPTIYSTIYTTPITLPTDDTSVELNVFATNGVISSPIITNTYETNILGQDARFPHSGTNAPTNPPLGTLDPAPFGAPPIQPNQQYLGPGAAGLTVDDPLLPQVSTGFDADGNPTAFTNGQDPYGIPTPSFPYLYSESVADNGGIGTFPPYTVIRDAPPPEQSNTNSPFFDPRASVIIQDSTQPINPLAPLTINRMNFSMENIGKVRSGDIYFSNAGETPTTTANFTHSYYNPVDNSMTYYFYDNMQQRWVISKSPFNPKPTLITDYSSGLVSGGIPDAGPGQNRVFQWVPFKGQFLM
jgi:Chitobiase/beta-hexosaminidase C-terminal domain